MNTPKLPLESLTPEQKIFLMEQIWADLSKKPEDVPATQWHGALLEQRRQAVQRGEMKFESWEDAKDELLKRFQ